MSESLPRNERRLWREGPNYTADVVAIDQEATKVLLIQRNGTGEWALPGGFIDPTDHSSYDAAVREADEEAGLTLTGDAPLIFRGKVDDPRNSNEAWIETSAHLFTAPPSLDPTPGDDAAVAAWCELANLPPLYGSHQQLIEYGLDYIDNKQLLDVANSPTALRRPIDGGYMQYDKWIIEDGDRCVFTKDCPTHNHRADELLYYIKKEAGIMAHLRQNSFRHAPDNTIFDSGRLIMDALIEGDGWKWRIDQGFINTHLRGMIDSLSELETTPLPPSAFDVEDSYDSFTKEGWQAFTEQTHQNLIDKYGAGLSGMPPHLQQTAQHLLRNAPILQDLACALPKPKNLVFCHHDMRQSNFAWHHDGGIKIIDWSWAGPGLPGSDATRLLTDLHKSGYDIAAYHDHINPEHCLNLIGFWLTRSIVPNQGAEGLRQQQFLSALSAYELLLKAWPKLALELADPECGDIS